jgi:hypothetical protein
MYRYDAVDDGLEYLGAAARISTPDAISTGIGDDGETAYLRDPGGGVLVWRDGVVKTAAAQPGFTQQAGFISPDGRYFAYEEGATPFAPGNVYLYDAATDQHSCASCLSNGALASGVLPEHNERFLSNRMSQAVTDAGQLFFTSSARLVATDVNGHQDVYMFQDGKASLISPGNAPFDAIFADISEDGGDVFFTSNQKLVGRDNDESPDIYDARLNGGLPAQSPPPPQECLRDDCKATPGAGPELPFGGSEALNGPGNVKGERGKRCRKGSHVRKVKGKARCVKQSKKKTKQAKNAGANRRQGR